MQEKMKSEGKCLFCEKTFAKSGIHRHLATHLKEKAAAGSSGKSFLIKVEPDKRYNVYPHFLSLWIDGKSKMEDLDSFLRKIWLDCCYHESEFTKMRPEFERKHDLDSFLNLSQYEMNEEFTRFHEYRVEGEVSMYDEAGQVLHKGMILEYNYDFEDTTSLLFTVLEQYTVKADAKIVLLSRNEPLAIMCSDCGKMKATLICTACQWHKDAFFCKQCAEKHSNECEDFDDTARRVANSPRMGKCKYKGGKIDKERDGVFYRK